jgi:type IV pilus assembly protein PilB
MARRRLGEKLLESGLISERQLAQALQAQQATGEQLGALLIRMGHLPALELLRVLCEDAGIPFSTLEDRRPEPDAVRLVPEALAREKVILPLALEDGRLLLAAADPFDFQTVQSLERRSGLRVSLVGAPRDRVVEQIDRAYGRATPRDEASAAPRTRGQFAGAGGQGAGMPAAERSPVERFERPVGSTSGGVAVEERGDAAGTAAQIADEVYRLGIAAGATDIHIEPREDGVAVRYRIDGILRQGPAYPKSVQAALLTRVKVASGLNIAENRLPQDGRLRISADGREVDMRVSTFPTLHGEDLVLRILDRSRVELNVERLGMSASDVKLFREIVRRPHGIILITGPTGSGKTTTLYAALAELNNGTRCILTLEDPIEYELDGVRQSQINNRAGLTFATGLRSLLRHDPDVILVGEMRDQETVQIGLSAAMTGHMVLSTLHTNTAAGAIPRLLDMGSEPFVIASTLQLSLAQRLIRTVCRSCMEPEEIPDSTRVKHGLEHDVVYRGRGCAACGNTGYRGRVGVYELLPITEEVAQGIHDRRSAEEIQRMSNRPTLLQDGLEKVRAGITSLEETLRAVSS